jgi:hypothetical protein
MEDEVKTQITDIQEQSVAPVTPTEPTVTPTAEPTVASQEPKETTGKEVTSGVQKRIDQVTAKYYAALDEKKQAVARAQKLEEEIATLKTPVKEASMFETEEPEDEGKAEVARLKKTVDAMEEQRQRDKNMAELTELFGELQGKYPAVTFEESIHILEELSKDDVPPQSHGAIEKYFAASEAASLKVQLQEKETKVERKQAVTEGKSVIANEHFPDDPMEALELLKSNPAKYEELAKKSGRRG